MTHDLSPMTPPTLCCWIIFFKSTPYKPCDSGFSKSAILQKVCRSSVIPSLKILSYAPLPLEEECGRYLLPLFFNICSTHTDAYFFPFCRNEYQIFKKIIALDYEFPSGFPEVPKSLVQSLLVRKIFIITLMGT